MICQNKVWHFSNTQHFTVHFKILVSSVAEEKSYQQVFKLRHKGILTIGSICLSVRQSICNFGQLEFWAIVKPPNRICEYHTWIINCCFDQILCLSSHGNLTWLHNFEHAAMAKCPYKSWLHRKTFMQFAGLMIIVNTQWANYRSCSLVNHSPS